MRVIIVGPTGMLGHQLLAEALKRHYEIWALSRSMPVLALADAVQHFTNLHWISGIDAAAHPEQIQLWMAKSNAEVIVNAAGLVKQAPKGDDMTRLLAINARFPRALEIMVSNRNTQLIHISSDCVFDGKRGFYRESDVPDTQDDYGKSKILGEVTGRHCLTLRTSIVGPEIRTRQGLFEWFRHSEGERVQGYTRSIFSGVSTFYLSRLLWDLAEQFPGLEGLYQVATEPISKYELLLLIRSALNLHITVDPDDQVVCNRSLSPQKLYEATGFLPPPWQHMLQDFKRLSGLVLRSGQKLLGDDGMAM
ncbi:MAG: sugar nucleotide-binding protein [Firmicutes bacterium]|nr:sugar nucleotide-binding protein [Bacillota bacterium]MCL5014509.1 sugar nucleotide-binding protein [Bacillota bacterium]